MGTYNQSQPLVPPSMEYCLYARKSSESDERQAITRQVIDNLPG